MIGQFEGVIQQLAALAALMPIVASIGGNTGNQTMALVIRSLGTEQIQPERSRQLLVKELSIGILNGSVWGVIVGGFAVLIYSQFSLGLVMTGAVVLNLVVAAAAGVLIPLGLHASGRDPAHGASVLLTFVTDGMGFFLFLGLARVFLVSLNRRSGGQDHRREERAPDLLNSCFTKGRSQAGRPARSEWQPYAPARRGP